MVTLNSVQWYKSALKEILIIQIIIQIKKIYKI